MYSDAAPAAPEEPKPDHDESSEGETTLIPKSMGMGKDFKVGDEIVLKIVGTHGDQFEVEYAPEKKEGSEEEEAQETPAQERAEQTQGSAGGEMQSLYG